MISSTPLFTTQPLSTTNLSSLPPRTTIKLHRPPPDKLAFLIDNSKTITETLQIHAFLVRHNLHHHKTLNFKLQRSYSSHGRLNHSVSLFNQTHNPNVFFYTSIIHTHVLNNLHEQALCFYIQMLTQNVESNTFTFSAILKSCPIEHGKAIQSQVIKFGFDSDTYVRTALVDVYAKDGDIESAQKLFDTMPEKSLVSLTSMLTCYAKHGHIEKARTLFDGLLERDIVCWNVMIDGYTQNARASEALALFRRMLWEKLKPNEVTLVSVLSACGQVGALESGKWVHSYAENNGIRLNVHLGTALVDMYSKCGSLEEAKLVFDKIKDKDVISWNSMINGYAIHGFGKEALQLFRDFCHSGLHPTDITFIGVLSACAHVGLVSEGWFFFNLMINEYGIEPKVEHYGCMVSLLGRAGKLKEAYKLVKGMKISPDSALWGSLLGACRLHGNVGLGEEIVEFLISRNLANSGTYILMSNIYAEVGDWDAVARMRTLMREKGVPKEPGCSSIEVNNKVHEFLAGDMKHPNSKEIYLMLEEINKWLEDHGYTPQTEIVLHDIGENEKKRSLEVHSEKLAIAFGLISTQPGSTIKIVKNLRVCPDCHAVTKLISKLTGRKIVVRDRNRFHHFVNGSCSCGDYW